MVKFFRPGSEIKSLRCCFDYCRYSKLTDVMKDSAVRKPVTGGSESCSKKGKIKFTVGIFPADVGRYGIYLRVLCQLNVSWKLFNHWWKVGTQP